MLIDLDVGTMVFLTKMPIVHVISNEYFGANGGIVHAAFDAVGVPADVLEMIPYVVGGHDQTNVADLCEISCVKVDLPVKGNVAALDNEILPIFHGGFDDFPQDRPQIGGECLVIQRCQGRMSATDRMTVVYHDGADFANEG